MKSDLDEIHSNNLSILHKWKAEIEHNITDITLNIAYIKKLLESDDATLTNIYKSRNSYFRKLHPKVKVNLPKFPTVKIDRQKLYQQFTSLLALSFTTEDTSGAESSPTDRPLMEEPLTIKSFKINRNLSMCRLNNVACVQDEKIWISGNSMTLYTLRGKLLK